MDNLDKLPGKKIKGKSKTFQTSVQNFLRTTPNIENKKNETKRTS